ncbi:uncharacterized protein LOC133815077 [Humulus lupulus]|uniref:uncharacterized protein LOC133815077 n=1 Tax=Humulus lupulus TaxID=3486 RepID=UPI002B4149E0|nr:uncharacterized protein LOC133815077 [Humulus lupulus]
MNVLSWNCRGLGNPGTFQFLKELVAQKKPNFLFLCETKCQKQRLEWVGHQLGFEGIICVEAQGRSGGLGLLWKHAEEGFLLGYSSNHIDLEVIKEGEPHWRLTGFYGESRRNFRRTSWTLLHSLAASSQLPWCVIGDFNNIAAHEDKRGGSLYSQWLIDGFQAAMNHGDLTDLDLVGYPFTWERGRGTEYWTEIRLDRAIVNSRWNGLFPNSKLSNLETSPSDHNPIFLEPIVVQNHFTHRHFRFENAWLKEPLCYQLVRDCWDSQEGKSFEEKLHFCAEKLNTWGRELTGNFRRRLRLCKQELEYLKRQRDSASIQRYDEVKRKLFDILDQREVFWKQRAKQFWLKEGDQNSKYFHKAASTRRRNNTIQKLKMRQGSLLIGKMDFNQ